MTIKDNNIFTFENYLEKYNKNNKYDIKELVLSKLGIDNKTFKIKSIQDIGELQFKYVKSFPFNNMEMLNGITEFYDLDYIVKELFINKNGSNCGILNLIFGLVLYEIMINDKECGITNVIRVSTNPNNNQSIPKQYEYKSYHLITVITFKGLDYFIECSLLEKIPYPIEIGSFEGTPFFNTNKLTRIIKSIDHEGDYIYQEKKPDETEYTSFFHFSKRDTKYNYPIENSKYLMKKYKIEPRTFIKFDNGSYFCDNLHGTFNIYYSNGPIIKYKIIDDNHLNQLISMYMGISSYSEKLKYTKLIMSINNSPSKL